MRKPFFAIITLLLICTSCNDSNKANAGSDSDYILYFNSTKEDKISSLVESVTFIPLENTEGTVFREASQVIFNDGCFYVRDMFNERIVAFNEDGSHLFTLDRKGPGPEEYLELIGFTVDESYLYLIDDCTFKLRMYDKKTSDYVGEKKLPIFTNDIAALDNGDFMLFVRAFDGYELPSRHRVFITDNDMNIKEQFLPYEKGQNDPMNKRYFFTTDDERVYLSLVMRDTVYSFSKSGGNERYETYCIDFGKQAIPQQYRYDYDKSLSYNFLSNTPFFSGDYIIFDVHDNEFGTHIYNRKTGKWYKNDSNDNYNLILFTIVAFSGKNIYSIIYDYEHYEALLEEGFNKASAEIESHLRAEGYVLVKYTLH